ncbi:TetR/AcrR family transcriptional regulator [Aeromicrobium chenweiae]|uniref:TetR family transcriptional regulator n=1 Tax=Aeromicrobium chenweiae TaxID=2079793 RepID=A0A2S0WI51_9ACTN|nr:TetR/AcrR family transcriptional regulator [Aeromicrobium chenweiae]AWB90910.1 TetR family transcriptional regulator [Aeromicrobium chenweiae]TGN32129.1 TetR/AcrR family transcriptional regulator [Aeromicrobium chenweiae]
MAGRPRSFDRDTALAAAVEQFWRTGYDETSIAMLTKAMGVTPPSLYAAFGDKDNLFEEASALYFRWTCEGLDRALARPTVRDAIATMLDDTARVHTDTGTPLGCLMLTEPRLAEQRAVVHRRLTDRIAQGLADGELPATVRPDELASFLVAVLRGMSGCARDGGSAEEVLAIARAAVAAIPGPPPSREQG